MVVEASTGEVALAAAASMVVEVMAAGHVASQAAVVSADSVAEIMAASAEDLVVRVRSLAGAVWVACVETRALAPDERGLEIAVLAPTPLLLTAVGIRSAVA